MPTVNPPETYACEADKIENVAVEPVTVEPVTVPNSAVEPVTVDPVTVPNIAVEPVIVEEPIKEDKPKKKVSDDLVSVLSLKDAIAPGLPAIKGGINKLTKSDADAWMALKTYITLHEGDK